MLFALLLTVAGSAPVLDAVDAWARTRKLYVEVEGHAAIIRGAGPHCYAGVRVELAGYIAHATGKDGSDCTDPERLEIAGYKRERAPPVWLVTTDSVYGSTLAAYELTSGKLILDTSFVLPTTDAAHYFLDAASLRVETKAGVTVHKWTGDGFTQDADASKKATAARAAAAAAVVPTVALPPAEAPAEERTKRKPLGK
jgi:hypothetical protein